MQISRNRYALFQTAAAGYLSLCGAAVCLMSAYSYAQEGFDSWRLPDPDNFQPETGWRPPEKRSAYQRTGRVSPAGPPSFVQGQPGQAQRQPSASLQERVEGNLDPKTAYGYIDQEYAPLPESEAQPQRMIKPTGRPEKAVEATWNFEVSYAMIGAVADEGGNEVAEIDTTYYNMGFRIKPKAGPVRMTFGATGERFTFEHDDPAPIPDRLYGANFAVGMDIPIDDGEWAIRISASPGIYGTLHDGVDGDDVNVPFFIAAGYFPSRDLQILFGLSVNLWREFPVVGGGGVRWKFDEHWTLNLLFPRPRIEWNVTEDTAIYLGGEFKGGTFRTHEGFGSAFGDSRLDNALVNYTDIRVGVGIDTEIAEAFVFQLESGLQVFREWDFHRAGVQFESEELNPHFKLNFSGKF